MSYFFVKYREKNEIVCTTNYNFMLKKIKLFHKIETGDFFYI